MIKKRKLRGVVASAGILSVALGCAGSTEPVGSPGRAATEALASGPTGAVEATAALATVGAPAPDFEFAWLHDGERGTLADLRGRVVLLEFWHTW